MKKGQAAMEFLMTYGWALLVVLLAIAALAFFGLLNPSRFLPEKCEFSSGISCVDFSAKGVESPTEYEDGRIRIIVNNGLSNTMKNVEIIVDNCEMMDNDDFYSTYVGSSVCFNEDGNTENDDGNSIKCGDLYESIYFRPSLYEGQSKLFTIACAGMLPGSKINTEMTISYETTVEGIDMEHTRKGTLIATVQEE